MTPAVAVAKPEIKKAKKKPLPPARTIEDVAVGDFVVGLDSASDHYAMTRAGVLNFVQEVRGPGPIHNSQCGCPACDDAKTQGHMRVIPLIDSEPEGRAYPVIARHFRLANEQEVAEKKSQVARAREEIKTHGFKTGDPVVLTQDVTILAHGMFGSGKTKIGRGTYAIVDMAPGDDDGPDAGPVNFGREREAAEPKQLRIGNFFLPDYVAPRLMLYFPELEEEFHIGAGCIKKRVPDMNGVKLVLPPDYMDKVQTVVRRVTDRQVQDRIYEKLGLHKVCQKGRGAIVLLYGPPGTGKTMTAEVLADRIGRPLIKMTIGNISNSEAIVKTLQQGFQRAKRYKAVLLLDEVDVFIQKRGKHPLYDENTSIFLRVLEYYDGILLMTTNLVNQIDSAIFSRVHLCLGYGVQQPSDRRAIWDSMIPDELRASIIGGDAAITIMLDELAKVPINGREIKTIIQNAVGRAVVRAGADKMATPRWIPAKYFIEEARELHDQRESLKGA